MQEDNYNEKLQNANKLLKIAEYLATTTYKLVKDPKILMNVLQKVHEAFDESIAALLYRDREVKLISHFHDSSQSRLNIFQQKCIKRYGFDKKIIATINELKELIEEHKNSPMEFTRKKEFIICNDNFKFKKVNVGSAKEFIDKAKEFVYKLEKIIQLNKFKE